MRVYVKYIIILSVVIFFTILISRGVNDDRNLRKNLKFTIGTIYSINESSKSGIYCDYNFIVFNKNYDGTVKEYIKSSKYESLVGKSFPVVYDSCDATNNDMLITPVDFKNYGFQYPDSLRWVIN